MCYASPVMLRGRRSCTISERPTPSSFVSSSLSRMLTPTIPVHPRNAPVSPIIPVHTQKQGGGALLLNFQLSTLNCLSLLAPTIPAPLATAALRVVPAPLCTTTSRSNVGAPTILLRERTPARKQFPDRRALLFPNCALLTADSEPLFSPKS